MHRSWSFPSRKYRWIGWSYYRLCENFWWLIIVSREQYWPQKCFFFAQFYKNFVSSLGPGCFGIWYSAEISVFSNVFGFSSGKLGSKMDQNCWLWVCRIGAKIQNFSRSFKHCVYLIRDKISKPLVKISARSINIWGSKAWKSKKVATSWCWIDSKNFENFKLHNRTCYTDETLTTNMYLNKVFQLAKSWSVTHIIGCKTA